MLLHSLSLAPMDYNAVNITEIKFTNDEPEETVKEFSITINLDSEVEPLEVFNLDVIPTRTAIVLTPRIQVEICGIGKTFFHVSMSLSCGSTYGIAMHCG